jgi:hypothetical protein
MLGRVAARRKRRYRAWGSTAVRPAAVWALVAVGCGGHSQSPMGNGAAAGDEHEATGGLAGEGAAAGTGSGGSPAGGPGDGGSSAGSGASDAGSSVGGATGGAGDGGTSGGVSEGGRSGGVPMGGAGSGGVSDGGTMSGGGAGSGGIGSAGTAGTAGNLNIHPPADCPVGACPTLGEVRYCNEQSGFSTIPSNRYCCAGQWERSCPDGMGGMGGMGGLGGVGGVPGCPAGCTPQPSGLCGSTLVTWVCTGGFDGNLFRDAGCTDPGTQVPRFCCEPTFKPECQ